MRFHRAYLSALLLAACSSTPPAGDEICLGSKCDTPGGVAATECQMMCGEDRECEIQCLEDAALGHCEARKNDAIGSAQKAFLPNAIRWAASDVDGVNQVNGDDRGQEYVEYFAVVELPPEAEGGSKGAARILGKNIGASVMNPATGTWLQTGETATIAKDALQVVQNATTPAGVELTEDQLFYLEDHPDEIMGQCVFTSWHADVPGPICNRDGGCDDVLGHSLADNIANIEPKAVSQTKTDIEVTVVETAESPLYRMLVGFNSNGAASSLVRDCAVVPEDMLPAEDLLEDTYMRGCMLTSPQGVTGSVTGFGTEWRRSDSAICVAAMRIAECGCGVDTDGDGSPDITDPQELGLALIPPQPQGGEITLRGFPLGTWSGFVANDILTSQLPAGCEYVDTGDGSQTIVSCDLTATDVLNNASDLKNACRTMYGDNVVVHVPVPVDSIVCSKPEGRFGGESCSDTPWVIE